MKKNKAFKFGCFINQFSRLKLWVELQIWKSLFSYSTKTLTLVFVNKIKKNLREITFIRLKKLYSLFLFFNKEMIKCIISPPDFQRESPLTKKKVLFYF